MTNRRLLASRIQNLEGEDNPYYFDSSKCSKTPQERIDAWKLKKSTCPEYAKHRKDLEKEISCRAKEQKERTSKFLVKRELELAEINSQEIG